MGECGLNLVTMVKRSNNSANSLVASKARCYLRKRHGAENLLWRCLGGVSYWEASRG